MDKSQTDTRLRARRVRVRTMDPATLGARLRHARIAAGLTQSEICAGISSTAYLSRIEAGQRRPSLDVLDGLAARVAVPVDELLDLEAADVSRDLRLALARAELHLAAGDTRVAISIAHRAEVTALDAGLEDFARMGRLLLARAHLRSGHVDHAADLLIAEVLRPDHGSHSVRVLVAWGRCQLETGAAVAAVGAGARATDLVGEQGLEGLPEAVEVGLLLSRAQDAVGDSAAAAATCALTLVHVPEVAATESLGATFRRASEAEFRSGALDDALLHAERAVVLLEMAAYRANIAALRARAGKKTGGYGNGPGHREAQ